MDDWHERPLEEFLARITYGFTNPMPTTDVGPYMVTARDINHGRILYDQARSTCEQAFREDLTDKSRPEIGDVLVTKDGTLGRVCIVDRSNVCINQSVALLKPSPNIRSRFLKYVLEEPNNHERMLGDADGTTIKHIYITRLARMRVCVPSLATQDAIVSVLGALDDKIDLNRRMNETLDAMARAIFKDWFVDFGPTRAKAEGRSPYLTPKIWALFPDRLDDGEYPEGWNIGTLGNYANLNPESWSRRSYPPIIKYVDLSGTKWGTIENIEPYDRTDAPSRAQRILLPGDTIIGLVRPANGSYALVSEDGLTGSTGFAVLRPIRSDRREFVYLTAASRENIDRLAHLADGAAYPAVRPEVVMTTEAPIVGDLLMKEFSLTTGPLIDRIEMNKEEAITLANLRDFLLPRLMSGEIRVKDAEKTLEAVI
jgi:type I restriction enzyme, S subunit